jgi:hypothetical protein
LNVDLYETKKEGGGEGGMTRRKRGRDYTSEKEGEEEEQRWREMYARFNSKSIQVAFVS